jgi:hypothetical protein
MKRFVLSVMLMLGLVATPLVGAAAQPTAVDTTFQSALTGDVIDLGTSGEIAFDPDVYDLSEGSSVSEEYIWFSAGWSNFELVIVGGDIAVADYYDVTLANMLEFYDEFEVVHEDVGTDHALFIADANYQGNDLVVFYDYELDALGDFDLLVMQFGPADALASDMEFVQQEVTVGNQPLLANIDAQEIQALATGEPGGTNLSETTPESGSGTGTGITERIGRAGSTGDSGTAEATEAAGTTGVTRTTRTAATVEPTEASGSTTRTTRTTRTTTTTTTGSTQATGSEWEPLGLVSDTEWVSPNFQTSVTWDGGMWLFPADNEVAIVIREQPVIYETLALRSVDHDIHMFVTILDTATSTPDSQADYFESEAYLDQFDTDVTIIEISTTENTAAVVYREVQADGDVIIGVRTATFMDDDTIITTQIYGTPENIEVVYGEFLTGVQVNGAPLELNYTPEEIAVLAGN